MPLPLHQERTGRDPPLLGLRLHRPVGGPHLHGLRRGPPPGNEEAQHSDNEPGEPLTESDRRGEVRVVQDRRIGEEGRPRLLAEPTEVVAAVVVGVVPAPPPRGGRRGIAALGQRPPCRRGPGLRPSGDVLGGRVGQLPAPVPPGPVVREPTRRTVRPGIEGVMGPLPVDDPGVPRLVPQMRGLVPRGPGVRLRDRGVVVRGVVPVGAGRIGVGRKNIEPNRRARRIPRPGPGSSPGMAVHRQPAGRYGRRCQGRRLLR